MISMQRKTPPAMLSITCISIIRFSRNNQITSIKSAIELSTTIHWPYDSDVCVLVTTFSTHNQ